MKKIIVVGLCLLVLMVAACAGSDESDKRLKALEGEVAALKARSQAREEALRKELGLIRASLENIRDVMAIEQGRKGVLPKTTPEEKKKSPAEQEKDSLDHELDMKAKTFVKENLERLLDISKKLLDRMEQELDQQMNKPQSAPAKPGGSEI